MNATEKRAYHETRATIFAFIAHQRSLKEDSSQDAAVKRFTALAQAEIEEMEKWDSADS